MAKGKSKAWRCPDSSYIEFGGRCTAERLELRCLQLLLQTLLCADALQIVQQDSIAFSRLVLRRHGASASGVR